MGREIRRVPPNWDHPVTKDKYGRDCRQPMHDETFDERFAKWLADFDRIRAGNLDEIERECYPRGLADWLVDEGQPPDPAYYRPWKSEEATWFQLWETVSEGTPVSPPFATEEELIDYLAQNGDEWDQKRGDRPWGRQQAEAFVKSGGWAPSLVMIGNDIMTGVEAAVRLDKTPAP